jgi:phosphate starvation-inducible protein PhoH
MPKGKSSEEESIQIGSDLTKINFKIKETKFKSPRQRELFQLFKKPESQVVLVNGPAGTAKAQPLDSPVLTTEGWKLMGDLTCDDYVYNDNGYPTAVVGIFPQGKKQVYTVEFDDGSSTECCDDHLWFTQTLSDRDHRERIPGFRKQNKRIKKPKAGSVKSLSEIRKSLKTTSGRLNHYIPITAPVEFEHKDFLIHPYLLGSLIGDGSITNYVGFATADIESLNLLNRIVDQDYTFTYRAAYDYSLVKKSRNAKPNIYKEELTRLGLFGKKSEDKFIPAEYLLGSKQQRINLLQGLMDTDGTTDGHCLKFCTVSEQLKENFVELVQSLGGVCTCKLKQTQGQDAWFIYPKLDLDKPFRLKRKLNKYIKRSKYPVIRRIKSVIKSRVTECQCIKVAADNSRYITNDYIVTHNTFMAIYAGLTLLKSPERDIDSIYYVRKAVESSDKGMGYLPGDTGEKFSEYTLPLNEKLEMFLEYDKINELHRARMVQALPINFLRGADWQNKCVILDEAQNLSRRELKTFLTRIGEGCKVFLIGDKTQSDIGKASWFSNILNMFKGEDHEAAGIFQYHLDKDDIFRSGICKHITETFEKVEKLVRSEEGA